MQKIFGTPTAQTIQARLTKPLFLEAELNNDYFLFSTNFDSTDRIRRNSMSSFAKQLSGPLAARLVNLDRHGLPYLKRNEIMIIFYSG